jgi:hypothetical protein
VARLNLLFNPGASSPNNIMSDLFFIVDDLPDSAGKFPIGANHTEDDTLTMFTFTRWTSPWRGTRYSAPIFPPPTTIHRYPACSTTIYRAYPFASPILPYLNFVGLIAFVVMDKYAHPRDCMFPIPTLCFFLFLFSLVHVAMGSSGLSTSTVHLHFPFLCTICFSYSKSPCLPP